MYDGPLPDLLELKPAARIDLEATRFGITMACAGSTSGGLFTDMLAKARPPASSWDAAGFANDLFLQRFAAQYFRIETGGHEATLSTSYLMRMLASPPSDPAAVVFRREILEELVAQPALRGSLESLYQALCRLRGLVENSGGARRFDINRHRLDTLAAAKRVFDLLAGGFGNARSGLSRLSVFGANILASEPYQALSDLLAHDAELATVALKVTVGADGRIRKFNVLKLDEASENPFTNPFWRRWLAQIELFLRGYRFSQAEVMARLIDSVFSGIEDELCVLVQLLGDIELYLGALGFRDRAIEAGLPVCLPSFVDRDSDRELEGLFNPLLFLSGMKPIPCKLRFDAATSMMLVTGPNSGGKTRLLQSIGLTQLLAQNGLFIPAARGSIAMVSGLVASLIEGTKADQAEGRLGMEMMRIRELFERLPPNAMVLLDELCSGTNPSEGEHIVELVLRVLHRLRPQAFITTHFLAFAHRLNTAASVPGLGFLQVALGPDKRPLYQFERGVADSSLAEATAERLGVTGDQLLGLVEQNLRRWQTLPVGKG